MFVPLAVDSTVKVSGLSGLGCAGCGGGCGCSARALPTPKAVVLSGLAQGLTVERARELGHDLTGARVGWNTPGMGAWYDFLTPTGIVANAAEQANAIATDIFGGGSSDSTTSVNWLPVVLVAGVGLLFVLGARSGRSEKLRSARERYENEVSRIRSEYSVRGRARRVKKAFAPK